MIIDEHTGRLMDSRRWSDGLHQAVEAKEERVEIKSENHTLATVSLKYFRLYNKLSGIVSAAKTEEEEFQKIYGLDQIEIPTNRPIARHDYADLIYRMSKESLDPVLNKLRSVTVKDNPF